MTELEVYVDRLCEVGYDRGEAKRVVDGYRARGDLDALEDYLTAKERVMR